MNALTSRQCASLYSDMVIDHSCYFDTKSRVTIDKSYSIYQMMMPHRSIVLKGEGPL